ncbi:flagellar protein FlaG protein [Desulfurispirillum indicum S5]|uniref:Flagellar protein FlaG protein n=1 Tax=Desulfurispirillum indicum (strain ATCC BAA-1389 / DSM 22839 / S5) TaxID=653733 RepID=E6W4Z8_DESIS|nr:flagellar protein FlaG [Desulfurispirillum indicum]ADU65974.1 flagellar protein FlaG protein [Desulfurispirillum indicum S5]
MQVESYQAVSPSAGDRADVLQQRRNAAVDRLAAGTTSEGAVARPQKNSGRQEAPSQEELQRAVEELNRNMSFLNVSRHFEVEESTDTLVVKLMDKQTGEVIRQIPSEEAIKRMSHMQDFLGMLYDGNA